MHSCEEFPGHDDIGNIVCQLCGILTKELDTVSESSDHFHYPKYYNGYKLLSYTSKVDHMIKCFLTRLRLPLEWLQMISVRLKAVTTHCHLHYRIAGLIYSTIKEKEIAIPLHHFLAVLQLDRVRFLRSFLSIHKELDLDLKTISPNRFLPLACTDASQNDEVLFIAQRLLVFVNVPTTTCPESWAAALASVAQEIMIGKRISLHQLKQICNRVAAPITRTKQRMVTIHTHLQQHLQLSSRGKVYYINLFECFSFL
jgi:hypothetical protein